MHEQKNEKNVWVGHTTKLFNELGISSPYYGETMFILQELGCVEQLRRGSGGSQSEWLILPQPERESFNTFMDERYQNLKKRAPSMAKRVKMLEAKVENLEEYMRKLVGGDFNAPEETEPDDGEVVA